MTILTMLITRITALAVTVVEAIQLVIFSIQLLMMLKNARTEKVVS